MGTPSQKWGQTRFFDGFPLDLLEERFILIVFRSRGLAFTRMFTKTQFPSSRNLPDFLEKDEY